MARKAKKGLDYFPLDTAFFNDIKIRKLIKYQSGNAVTVYICLLCYIYKDGYYIKWDKELPFIISEDTGFDEAFITEAIKCCISVELFSKKIYTENEVLTSKPIQERYELICKTAKKTSIISEFNAITPEVMPITPEEIPITSEVMPQSKVKESKVNETKVNEITAVPELKHHFRLREIIYYEKISGFFAQNFQSFREQFEMKNGSDLTKDVLEKMDAEKNGYSFTNENHIQNTFTNYYNKVKKEKSFYKPQTNGTQQFKVGKEY